MRINFNSIFWQFSSPKTFRTLICVLNHQNIILKYNDPRAEESGEEQIRRTTQGRNITIQQNQQ